RPPPRSPFFPYTTLFRSLASPDIDAVVIATPPFEHPRMLEAAVQAGKHIYCEKPAGVDIEGVKRVIATARKADPKKNISFGFQRSEEHTSELQSPCNLVC